MENRGKKMKKNKKLNKKNVLVIFLIVIIFLLSIFLYSNILDYISVYETKEIYAEVKVSDRYGFEINDSSLKFGMIPPGNSASKDISLENIYGKEVKIKIYTEGEIGDFITISENDFILKKDEKKQIGFSVVIPLEAEYGIYTGNVTVVVMNAFLK